MLVSTPGTADRLLELVNAIQESRPGEPRTLPIRVDLLARKGEKEAARKAVRDAVDREPPHDASTLLRLANVSREADLGLSDACLDRCEKAHGLSPNLALARAGRLEETRGPQAAVDDLRRTRETVLADGSAANRTRLTWRMTTARFLERTDPRPSGKTSPMTIPTTVRSSKRCSTAR